MTPIATVHVYPVAKATYTILLSLFFKLLCLLIPSTSEAAKSLQDSYGFCFYESLLFPELS